MSAYAQCCPTGCVAAAGPYCMCGATLTYSPCGSGSGGSNGSGGAQTGGGGSGTTSSSSSTGGVDPGDWANFVGSLPQSTGIISSTTMISPGVGSCSTGGATGSTGSPSGPAKFLFRGEPFPAGNEVLKKLIVASINEQARSIAALGTSQSQVEADRVKAIINNPSNTITVYCGHNNEFIHSTVTGTNMFIGGFAQAQIPTVPGQYEISFILEEFSTLPLDQQQNTIAHEGDHWLGFQHGHAFDSPYILSEVAFPTNAKSYGYAKALATMPRSNVMGTYPGADYLANFTAMLFYTGFSAIAYGAISDYFTGLDLLVGAVPTAAQGIATFVTELDKAIKELRDECDPAAKAYETIRQLVSPSPYVPPPFDMSQPISDVPGLDNLMVKLGQTLALLFIDGSTQAQFTLACQQFTTAMNTLLQGLPSGAIRDSIVNSLDNLVASFVDQANAHGWGTPLVNIRVALGNY